jgi:hypothetical protein
MNNLAQTHKSRTPQGFKIVLFAGILLFAFYASTHMVAAGDTWVALACGRHFANHGVDTVEPFSFNSHHAGPTEEDIAKWPGWAQTLCKPFSLKTIQKWHPTGWINQNWLTHLTFYKLASWFGKDGDYNYNTLVYWKFAIYFLAAFCVYGVGKVLGAGDFLSAAAACMAMLVGRTFFDIRPAGYSNLLVPVYILILVLATYRNYRFIWLLIPLVIFWANVHGGYIYAFIMLVPFVGIHLLLRFPQRWSICLGFVGLWLFMYLMSYKFISNTYYAQVQNVLGNSDFSPTLFKSKLFVVWVILAIISVAFANLKKMESGLFYAYHIGGGAIYFLSIGFSRFFLAEVPRNLSQPFKDIYGYYVFSSQMTFLFISVIGAILILLMALKRDRFIALPMKGIYHTIGAGAVGFIAMIIFNPFHLTNLTHTFEISVSKHAESWRQVNEWKPAFDWMDKTTSMPNPVGNEEVFGVLCILTLVVILFWLVFHLLKPQPAMKGNRRNRTPETEVEAFEWPKIDLAIIIVSLLTLYMAIRSRRFIALAGSAAAPIVFMMIFQSWQMLSTRFSWKKTGLIQPIPLRPLVQKVIRYGVFLVILGLGIFWACEYKRIYLDFYPANNQYYSVFMRMTASYLKPFEVCRFINENHITGHVFNYWTEGGAIAFGQEPDPEIGQIPLKLFMDGRAQAAYNHDKFRLWQEIFSGGPDGQKAASIQRQLAFLRKQHQTNTNKYKNALETVDESLRKAGPWIHEQLRDHNVWVVLMPKSQEDSIFMQAIRKTSNWKTAYIDNTQHLLVDSEASQGKALLNRILQDVAVFPNAYSKNLSTAQVIIESQDAKRSQDLYRLTKNAFDESPQPTATLAMRSLIGFAMFRENAIKDLKQFLNDFVKNKDAYMKKNGALSWLSSAEIAARTLSGFDSEEKDTYRQYSSQFNEEAKSLGQSYIW